MPRRAPLTHPELDELELVAVLQALADPVRLQVVRALAGTWPEPVCCASLGLPVAKATGSHHLRVLREAGVILQRDEGRFRMTVLRRDDLEARFPGLLALATADAS